MWNCQKWKIIYSRNWTTHSIRSVFKPVFNLFIRIQDAWGRSFQTRTNWFHSRFCVIFIFIWVLTDIKRKVLFRVQDNLKEFKKFPIVFFLLFFATTNLFIFSASLLSWRFFFFASSVVALSSLCDILPSLFLLEVQIKIWNVDNNSRNKRTKFNKVSF